MLRQHGSVPAFVIDARWNIRMRNAAAANLFAEFRTGYQLPEHLAGNVLHILCHPAGLRQFMLDWADYAAPFVDQIHRQATLELSATAATLRDAVQSYPGVPELRRESKDGAGRTGTPPLLRLRRGRQRLSFHTAFTTFSLPFDDAGKSVKMECLYPADGPTAAAVRSNAGG